MDEQRQPDNGTGHADAAAWRINGAHDAAASQDDQRWSSAGAALEPSAEPLALLAGGRAEQARHRQRYVPGLDDDTPVSGTPATEPPLWREASRHSYTPSLAAETPTLPATDPAPNRNAGAWDSGTRDPGTRDSGTRDSAAPDSSPGEEPTVLATGRAEPAAKPHFGYEPPPLPPTVVAPAANPVPPPPPAPPALPDPAPPPPPPPASQEPPTEPAGQVGMAGGLGLPQRVPAEPDVPMSTEVETSQDPPAAASDPDLWTEPELAFIAKQLRRNDVPAETPPETLDVEAVVAAVREVDGVQEAAVRTNPTGMHTLQLELADDADPGQVSRDVARLLLERMGLSAAPQHVPQARTPQETTVPPPPPDWQPPWQPLASPPPEPAPPRGAPQPLPPAQRREPRDAGGADSPPAPDPPDPAPEPVSRPLPGDSSGARAVIDQVQVRTFGLEARVEVGLTVGDRHATGEAAGPAVDSYLIRLAAVAAAQAIDELLRDVVEPSGPSRCFIEHTGVVPFGNTEVAVVVLLLACGGWVEQLTGSSLVDGDPWQAMVRATLGAVNRRLSALLD